MRISFCTIILNEAKGLKRMLDSVKDFVDEIIILDNGSTDNSVDIAKQYRATIIHDNKKGNLAYLRNRTLELATGDWIFSLDGDEMFDVKNYPKVKKIMKTCDAISFNSRYYTKEPIISHEWHKEGYVDILWGIRLFKRIINGKKVYYEGAMHEMVDGVVNSLHGHHKNVDMPIHHYKLLTPEDNPVDRFKLEKANRVRSFNNCAAHHFRLGKGFLYIDRNYKKAHYHFDKALSMLEAHQNYIHFFKGLTYQQQGEVEKSIIQFLRAISYNPKYAGAYYLLGLAYDSLGFYNMADNCFKEAVKLQPHHPIYREVLGKIKIAHPDSKDSKYKQFIEDLPVMGIGLS